MFQSVFVRASDYKYANALAARQVYFDKAPAHSKITFQ
jgi:hypothetical protein